MPIPQKYHPIIARQPANDDFSVYVAQVHQPMAGFDALAPFLGLGVIVGDLIEQQILEPLHFVLDHLFLVAVLEFAKDRHGVAVAIAAGMAGGEDHAANPLGVAVAGEIRSVLGFAAAIPFPGVAAQTLALLEELESLLELR